ncbi:unnamed protein product [Bursaphelenchus xylophilus]|uniref:Protein transport protein sec16 n=1 Tax=Bursaphelenchus xylophilus TaxID=6326 RepID=A0A1I7S0I2_BURXY|nr:unnamed protein product [Bursaphelenchus xylophilus]CAG9132267.1 unnamed protein product [Bursaphelenchus xylophilus]
MAGANDFGESFVMSSRKNRHRRSDYGYTQQPRMRPNSELGEPLRYHQQNRPNSAFRYRSGRTPAFEDFRETSSSEEFEQPGVNYVDQQRYPQAARASGSRRMPPLQQEPAMFSDEDIAFCTIVQLRPSVIKRFVIENEPPEQFWDMKPVEKAAFLFYYSCYNRYITDVPQFLKVFNSRFYAFMCNENLNEEQALIKICDLTKREYQALRQRQAAIRQQLEERSTIESQNSEQPSFSNLDSDELSLDSGSKEAKKFNSHHPIIKFGPAGRIIQLNPKVMPNSFELKNVKNLLKDKFELGNVELMDQFQGPLNIAHTQSQSVLLFIRRQLSNIVDSDIYIGNPYSSDTNDCILVWRLLEMVVKQQGRVTGADLAELLCKDQIFPKRALRAQKSIQSDEGTGSQESLRNERSVPADALEHFTNYLLGGHVDEAIKCAENAGLLFDAMVLAYRMYADTNRPKMESILQRLLAANRSPHHPAMTLYSVAASQPVPLLMHSDSDDGKGWRAHIAIVLANLKTDAAIDSICQLGRALAAKDFNSAADFCFLAANLLSDRDCFTPPNEAQPVSRQHIELIKATLPDDHVYSQDTRFGWSILDFCATEIYEYALRLKYNGAATPLTKSAAFQKRRLEYAQLLNDYGGSAPNVSAYCTSIAENVWEYLYGLDQRFVADLCDLAESLKVIGAQSDVDTQWIDTVRQCYIQHYLQNPQSQPPPEQLYHQLPAETPAPELQKTGDVTEINPEPVPEHHQVQQVEYHQQPVMRPRPDSALSQISQYSAFSAPKKTNDSRATAQTSSRTYSESSVASENSKTSRSSSHRTDNATPEAYPHRPIMNSTPVPPKSPQKQEVYHQQAHNQVQSQHQEHQQQDQGYSQFTQEHQNQNQYGYGDFYSQKSQESQRKDSQASYVSHQSQAAQELAKQMNSLGLTHQAQFSQYREQTPATPTQKAPTIPENQHEHGYENRHVYGNYQQNQGLQSTTNHQGYTQQSVGIQPQGFEQPILENNQIGNQQIPQQKQGIQPQQQTKQSVQPQQFQQQQFAQPQQQFNQQNQQSQEQNGQENRQKEQKKDGKGGLFGGLKSKLISIIPSTSEMILPDDSKKSIVWDEKLGRYVGDGVEEEVAPPPPPSIPMAQVAPVAQPTPQPAAAPAPTVAPTAPQVQSVANPMFGGIPQPTQPVVARSRLPKGSRGYTAPANGFATAPAAPAPMNLIPAIPTGAPVMNGFGFIPQAADNEDSSPFSDSPFQQPDPNQQQTQQTAQ